MGHAVLPMYALVIHNGMGALLIAQLVSFSLLVSLLFT